MEKMKQNKLILIAILLFSFSSCNFLDFDERSELNEDMVFGGYASQRNFLYSIYQSIPNVDDYVDGSMLACATDDAEYINEFSAIQRFNSANITVSFNPEGNWDAMYTGIRKCNVFLENATVERLDDYKYNLDEERDGDQYYPKLLAALEYERAEARFLRAYFYFELIKRYGGVPLITDSEMVDYEAGSFNLNRSSFTDCKSFIVTELNAIIPKLPVVHDSGDGLQGETGRATKGTAMALKSRLLLYAASPLFNSSNDVNLWKQAANAAADVIDEDIYSLEGNFENLFTKSNSNELIFERRVGNSNSFERANYPIGYDGGNTGTCPSQNLVDAFEMVETGLPISDANSGYDPNMPYNGRDPRLNTTVLHNESNWAGRTVEIWEGGLDASPILNATKTGYYLKKYLNSSVKIGAGQDITQRHTWYIFRFGEIYLNLAEAMNEAYGPETDPDAVGMTALDAVNRIRNRAGMPDFPTGLSKDAFRIKLQNERRVEFAFENQRYWDVKRWKIGSQAFGGNLLGVTIQKVGENQFNYTTKVVESRTYAEKMNLYPIPFTEVVKANLAQNDGW